MNLGIKSRKFRGISQDFVELVGFVPSYPKALGVANESPYSPVKLRKKWPNPEQIASSARPIFLISYII